MTGAEPEEHRETQVLVASTVYGVATLVAAIEDSLLPPAPRRILVLSNNAANPEAASPLESVAGFEQLAKRFDAVYSYNDAVAPQHPSEWMPRPQDVPLWDRHFRQLWDVGVDDHVRLVVESIHVRPAAALCAILTEAEIEVYADGLMSYGPTRSRLPAQVATRVTRLLYLDLVAGVEPLLLSEWQVARAVVSSAAFRTVLAEISPHAEMPPLNVPVTVLLGQYLSALGILTADEEAELHLRMLRGVAALGHRQIVFKPHPTATGGPVAPMQAEAAALGVDLVVWDAPLLAECLYERLTVRLVVGCFSTALVTAASLYGLPVARVGTELLLERLRPFQNSNRVPATLVDALLPELRADGELDDQHPVGPAEVSKLVAAVGYVMQPTLYPWLRPSAERFLRARYPQAARYFKRKRLTQLGLPGALSSAARPSARRRRRPPGRLLARLLRQGRSRLKRILRES